MAARVPARLTPAQGRRFGLTVGGAFLLFAALAVWRDHSTVAAVLGMLGSGLGLAGVLIPTRLGGVERTWMKGAHALSRLTTPIVMGLMFLVVFTPAGLLRRTLGSNPLVHREAGKSFWRARPEGQRRSASLVRQF